MSNVSQLKGTDNTTYDIVSKIGRGLVRATMDSTSTSTAFKVTADGITELYAGLAIIVKNTVIASASGCTLQVNNLTAKGMVRSIGGSAVTSHWALNAEYIFIYNGTAWVMQMGYDSNSDTKVRQTLKSDNVDRPLLMSYSDNSTTTGNVDNVSYRNNSIYANASTGIITANGFVGDATDSTARVNLNKKGGRFFCWDGTVSSMMSGYISTGSLVPDYGQIDPLSSKQYVYPDDIIYDMVNKKFYRANQTSRFNIGDELIEISAMSELSPSTTDWGIQNISTGVFTRSGSFKKIVQRTYPMTNRTPDTNGCLKIIDASSSYYRLLSYDVTQATMPYGILLNVEVQTPSQLSLIGTFFRDTNDVYIKLTNRDGTPYTDTLNAATKVIAQIGYY